MGSLPLADHLLVPDGADTGLAAPLTLAWCESCKLAQIVEVVSPEVLFSGNYPYYSSVSPALREHFRESSERIRAHMALDQTTAVLEIASNDGCMLQNFKKLGVPVLGIDPAPVPAAVANRQGIPTDNDFFGPGSAASVRERFPDGVAVVIANNVLAHVTEPVELLREARQCLRTDGLLSVELPWLACLVEHTEFDTIYHQHQSYFSIHALDRLFQAAELSIIRIEQTEIHGGSLRVHGRIGDHDRAQVEAAIQCEQDAGMTSRIAMDGLAAAAKKLSADLLSVVEDELAASRRLVGFGAAAKAATLLSQAGLGRHHLEFIADNNSHKHGLLMNGSKIPIVAPHEISRSGIDTLLILAWNFSAEIMASLPDFKQQGGRFIIPVPKVQLIA